MTCAVWPGAEPTCVDMHISYVSSAITHVPSPRSAPSFLYSYVGRSVRIERKTSEFVQSFLYSGDVLLAHRQKKSPVRWVAPHAHILAPSVSGEFRDAERVYWMDRLEHTQRRLNALGSVPTFALRRHCRGECAGRLAQVDHAIPRDATVVRARGSSFPRLYRRTAVCASPRRQFPCSAESRCMRNLCWIRALKTLHPQITQAC
jgi:hypothetical protein